MCASQANRPHTDSSTPFSLHTSVTLKAYFACASLIGSLSVALQAIAAHLPNRSFSEPHGRDMVHTAANIGLWHSIALCALIIGAPYFHPLRARIAYSGMIVGTLLFSVSVTLHGLNSISKAPLAPWGGSLLILSWLVIGSAVFQRTPPSRRE